MREAPRAFRRSHRLLQGAEFQRAFSQGKRVADRNFVLISVPNGYSRPRLGLAIGKKAAPKAVDRNRLKRLVRESFRQHADLPSSDFVVLARASARHQTNERLTVSLDSLWRRSVRTAENAPKPLHPTKRDHR